MKIGQPINNGSQQILAEKIDNNVNESQPFKAKAKEASLGVKILLLLLFTEKLLINYVTNHAKYLENVNSKGETQKNELKIIRVAPA